MLIHRNYYPFVILTKMQTLHKAVLPQRCDFHHIGSRVDALTVVPGVIPGQTCAVEEVAVRLMAQGETARTGTGVSHCGRNCVEEIIKYRWGEEA